jgi:hypothetical protein
MPNVHERRVQGVLRRHSALNAFLNSADIGLGHWWRHAGKTTQSAFQINGCHGHFIFFKYCIRKNYLPSTPDTLYQWKKSKGTTAIAEKLNAEPDIKKVNTTYGGASIWRIIPDDGRKVALRIALMLLERKTNTCRSRQKSPLDYRQLLSLRKDHVALDGNQTEPMSIIALPAVRNRKVSRRRFLLTSLVESHRANPLVLIQKHQLRSKHTNEMCRLGCNKR